MGVFFDQEKLLIKKGTKPLLTNKEKKTDPRCGQRRGGVRTYIGIFNWG